jgi:hypothetical protein
VEVTEVNLVESSLEPKAVAGFAVSFLGSYHVIRDQPPVGIASVTMSREPNSHRQFIDEHPSDAPTGNQLQYHAGATTQLSSTTDQYMVADLTHRLPTRPATDLLVKHSITPDSAQNFRSSESLRLLTCQ